LVEGMLARKLVMSDTRELWRVQLKSDFTSASVHTKVYMVPMGSMVPEPPEAIELTNGSQQSRLTRSAH
jgi:hypothetical protein